MINFKDTLLSTIQKLAGQTLWYGVPTIASRFLGYLLNMALPFLFAQPAVTADLTQVYAIIPFLNILFTYGVETAYFRYAKEKDPQQLYHTLGTSILCSTLVLAACLLLFRNRLAAAAGLEAHPEYITWMCCILVFDTLATLPFARLRQQGRPRRYALVRLSGIVINIAVVVLFLGILPAQCQTEPNAAWCRFFDADTGIGYYLIGNCAGSIVTFLLLWTDWKQWRPYFNTRLWTELMRYSYTLIIVGMGGMINDMLSRLVYQHVVDLPEAAAKHELGVFANQYRIAVLITIMIQAFRMAAEPFFFNQAKEENPQRTYARIMKFFVIACCFMFLAIGLYLDLFRWIITLKSAAWGEGIEAVLLLALGNVLLGIYYNLSIWYKLTNKNLYGAAITLGGAVITVLLNIWLIPHWHYWGAATATFVCYLVMMVSSYLLGQRHYPVPYARKKLLAYLALSVLLVLIHQGFTRLVPGLWLSMLSGTALLLFFGWWVAKIESKELQRIPLLARLFRY